MLNLSELKFDRMRSADITSVMLIEQDSFAFPWHREDFEIGLNDENIHYFVLRHNNKIVAYVVFTITFNKAHIANVAVHTDYRRKGIGSELLRRTLNYIQSQGVREVTLEVRVGNIAAQNLYSKFGFKVVGFRKNYYIDNNESALVMAINNLSLPDVPSASRQKFTNIGRQD